MAVAGTNVDDIQIGICDPDADAAEDGGEGQIRGADHDHDGDTDGGTSLQYRETDYDFVRHNIGKSFASQDAYDTAPAFIQDASPDQWQLAILGDPFTHATAQEPFHAEDAGGAFDPVSSSIVDDAFLAAFDTDGDVDMLDASLFHNEFTGS